MKRCPHKDIRFCPLYHANHMGTNLGCDDGRLEDACGVARKMSYAAQVAKMRVKHPGYVEHLEWKQDVEDLAAQRRRNLRAAGLH